MNQFGPMPGGGDAPQWGQHAMYHDAWWRGGGFLLLLLLLAGLIAVLVWGILRLSSQRGQIAAAATAAAGPPPPVGAPIDPAGQALRVRYARGEIGREDFLTRWADLGLGDAPMPPPAQQE